MNKEIEMNEITNQKYMTTKEVANQLNTSPKVIIENARKCLPNKVFENGKQTFWTEEEVTILLEFVKINSNRTDTTFTTGSKGMITALTNTLQIEFAYKQIEELHKQIEGILKNENEKLKVENEELKDKSKSLEIELDKNKEWYSIKRMEILNPNRQFSWRLLKKESEKLGYEIKKVFDQN